MKFKYNFLIVSFFLITTQNFYAMYGSKEKTTSPLEKDIDFNTLLARLQAETKARQAEARARRENPTPLSAPTTPSLKSTTPSQKINTPTHFVRSADGLFDWEMDDQDLQAYLQGSFSTPSNSAGPQASSSTTPHIRAPQNFELSEYAQANPMQD